MEQPKSSGKKKDSRMRVCIDSPVPVNHQWGPNVFHGPAGTFKCTVRHLGLGTEETLPPRDRYLQCLARVSQPEEG